MSKNENHFDKAIAGLDEQIARVSRRQAPRTAGGNHAASTAATVARLQERRANVIARKAAGGLA